MNNNQKQTPGYELMKGEYLSRMASTEYLLSNLITELLDVAHHPKEFQSWFVKTPIPFDCKADLFISLVKEDTQLNQFRTLITSLRSLNNFRNILAHSFNSLGETKTARGLTIPSTKVSFGTLKSRLIELRSVENLILNFLASCIEGNIPPISADDFADSPP